MSTWRPCAGGDERGGAPRRPPAGRAAALAVAAAGALAAAAPGATHELRGSLALVDRGGRPEAGSNTALAVVYFEPRGGGGPAAPGRFEILTRGKQFEPRVLAVPRGSTVRFPNADPILHNVFSVSPDNAFDLGLYGKGAGKEVKFDRPGVVRVFCNVHHSMVAYVVVLATRFFAVPDARGAFALAGLPAGDGTLTVWHERAEPSAVEVRVPAAAPLRVQLATTKPRVPPHLNKFGRSYRRAGRDRYQR